MTAGEYNAAGEFPEDGSDDDDIARFERQCAERARAQGHHLTNSDEDEEDAMSDDDQKNLVPAALQAEGGGEWQQRCTQLQAKLARRETELSQMRGDLDLLKNESSTVDVAGEIKQRLLDVTKKYRRAQVTVESQKSRIQQLEVELRKPRAEVQKQAEELAAQTYGAMLGDGEDYKNKFLQASNKLQEARQEIQELRVQCQRQKKVLVKELGPDEPLDRAMATADDPNIAGWKGRAAQISQLQRQVRELRDQMKRNDGADLEEESARPPRRVPAAAEKDRAAVSQAADKRREEFEKLQEEAERLRNDNADAKRKRDALKSRSSMLESQLREMKTHVQTLVGKSENDDKLVSALRHQLGRPGACAQSGDEDGELDTLRQDNERLQEQLERQAQIVLQLKQQQKLAATCEMGSVRLGPRSVDPQTPPHVLADRVRFLEAENAKQTEHVKLLRRQLGEDDMASSRPFSAESSVNMKEKFRQMEDRLAMAERENLTLRERADERPPTGIAWRSDGERQQGIGPDTEQLLQQNGALKREVARLRAAGSNSRDRIDSPCSSLGGDH